MVREERQQKYFPCSMTHDTVDAVLCIVDMLSRGEGCVRLQWLCACPEADPLPLQSRMHAGAWWLVTVTTRTTDRLDKCYKQTPTTISTASQPCHQHHCHHHHRTPPTTGQTENPL